MSTDLLSQSPSMNGELQARNTFVEQQARGEVDQQIATAKRFPRSVKKFKEAALSLATLDEDTAASCFYAVPRDGKTIEGPSARLAEIVAASWGNLRVTASIVNEDDAFVTARGMAWDLENNVAVATEVRRRITGRNGKRYSDDMIITTSNAACSIALRNALFKVVPFAMIRPIFAAAKKLAIGDATTLVQKRTDMVTYFAKMGVSLAQVIGAVDKPSIDDVTVDDLGILRGLATAIKDGDTTIEEAFPVPEKPAAKTAEVKSKSDKLAGELAAKASDKKAEEKPEPAKEIEQPGESEVSQESPVTREPGSDDGPTLAEELRNEAEGCASAKSLTSLRKRVIEAFQKALITNEESAQLNQMIALKRKILGLDD